MGTVGLSFGSPTSGAGFDVASTVATMVTNLQKVEAPWKTQLTALQSQDSVLSSLGTLLSNLHTDVARLTDFTGVLAQKTGSSSDNNVLELSSATSAAVAGTHTVVVKNLAQTSSGFLAPITNSSDTLSGSVSIQVGAGQTHTVTVDPSRNTLAGLASAINSAGIGVTASVLTDSKGSRLSLVSATSGGNGDLTVTSSIVDASNSNAALSYKPSSQGLDAQLTVDGVDLSSASNTVTNLIPGVTFQLLAPSDTQTDGSRQQVQVVIGNDNSGVESAISQMVSDYNALMKAVIVQQGKDSSGNPEPLFGSPTPGLLQQQLMSSINQQNPNGYLSAISAGSSTTLSGSMTIQVGNGVLETVVIGAAPDPPAANTIYTGEGVNTLRGVADALNAANIGVTAAVTTVSGRSTLSFFSQTAGSAGALTVNSSLTALRSTLLGYGGLNASGNASSSGALDSVTNKNDALSGTITIQVGSNSAQTVSVDPAHNTLQDLADAINNTSGIGVTASIVTNTDGSGFLSLKSLTEGSDGNLTVTSNVYDTVTSNLNYTNSSDIATLANLGITTSQNYDGSLAFDASVLDSALNTDFNGVLGFFQNAGSWGQAFTSLLNNAGNTSSKGIVALAQKANSSMEKTLNDEISKEEAVIAARQKNLTAELNQANQIMQSLPSQLDGMNMLYSAITGYNQGRG